MIAIPVKPIEEKMSKGLAGRLLARILRKNNIQRGKQENN